MSTAVLWCIRNPPVPAQKTLLSKLLGSYALIQVSVNVPTSVFFKRVVLPVAWKADRTVIVTSNLNVIYHLFTRHDIEELDGVEVWYPEAGLVHVEEHPGSCPSFNAETDFNLSATVDGAERILHYRFKRFFKVQGVNLSLKPLEVR